LTTQQIYELSFELGEFHIFNDDYVAATDCFRSAQELIPKIDPTSLSPRYVE